MNTVKVRFIRLGKNSSWAKECIEKGILKLGYESTKEIHQDALNNQWDSTIEYWSKGRDNSGAVTRDVNQIRDFYELSENDYFITFYQDKLWWCQPKGKVERLSEGQHIRETKNGWKDSDTQGVKTLFIDTLDGRITKCQAYQGTICSVECSDKLLKRINNEESAEVIRANNAKDELVKSLIELIKGLNPKDFELLSDLIFSGLGWRRLSVLGKTKKGIDLVIYNPITQTTSNVQVKTQTNNKEIMEYIELYKEDKDLYFVYHTNRDKEDDIQSLNLKNNGIYIWNIKRVAELVVEVGLIQWVIDKSS